jgi:hypothetical protein
MAEIPYCEDSSLITRSHLMFSINQGNAEIRFVETPEDKHPRLVLIDRTKKLTPEHLFFEIDSEKQFKELWAALALIARPLVVVTEGEASFFVDEPTKEAKQ